MKDPLPFAASVTEWLQGFIREAREVARAADALVPKLKERPDDVVVNVHAHAWQPYESFLRKYFDDGRRRVVALSMNPARNGAVQTGISFTDAPTARELLPDFDRQLTRPEQLKTDRVEMSGQHIRAWAKQDFGDLPGLYKRILTPIACPVAVLRGPDLLNVPLPLLKGDARKAADAFYEWSAPRLVAAAKAKGILFLGDYAAHRWARAPKPGPLANLPTVLVPHPAARMANEAKYDAWTNAVRKLTQEAQRGSGAPRPKEGSRRWKPAKAPTDASGPST